VSRSVRHRDVTERARRARLLAQEPGGEIEDVSDRSHGGRPARNDDETDADESTRFAPGAERVRDHARKPLS
jgi:hypothetical protein